MFSVDVHTRVFIANEPVDFRKQIDGLALIVQDTLQLDPFSAHLFVFTNRPRDKLKLLYWHHNGYVLLYKRLEKGRFVWPATDSAPLCISVRELHSLIEGGDISRLPAIKPVRCTRV
jgi:transposase